MKKLIAMLLIMVTVTLVGCGNVEVEKQGTVSMNVPTVVTEEVIESVGAIKTRTIYGVEIPMVDKYVPASVGGEYWFGNDTEDSHPYSDAITELDKRLHEELSDLGIYMSAFNFVIYHLCDCIGVGVTYNDHSEDDVREMLHEAMNEGNDTYVEEEDNNNIEPSVRESWTYLSKNSGGDKDFEYCLSVETCLAGDDEITTMKQQCLKAQLCAFTDKADGLYEIIYDYLEGANTYGLNEDEWVEFEDLKIMIDYLSTDDCTRFFIKAK